MADELGKIVRPQSPTRTCNINPGDKSHIGLILSESRVTEKSCERLLSVRANEIVCALSSKTIYLSNSGQVISNIDLPYYWCNFCTFKTEEKHQLLTHLMDHRFSCQYCVFQTFSRVDVVRHTVQEHSEFDGSDLKVCVLLPDLLKHGLNQSNDKSKKSPKDQSKSNSESELETKSPDSKRKRIESGGEEDMAKKKKDEGPPRVGRRRSKRGRPPSPESKPESEHNVRTRSEEDNKVTGRTTRSSPKSGKKDRMPGVCFECSVCKFRTFKKAILGKHTELEHDIARPRFALKIVSLSQAQEIDASDEKNKAILKETVPSSSNVKEKTEMKIEKSAPLPEPEPSKNDAEDEEEEEEVNDAVVEMDYAEEDDEDENEDAEVDEDTNKDHEPDIKRGNITGENNPVPSDPTQTEAVVKPGTFTCLLCSAIHDSTFSVVKNHYLDGHPGGTLVMGEVTAGSSVVQWVYFCVGTMCNFSTTNPVSWMTHSRICQKIAYETPNLSNSQHASVKNTVNALKENMMMANQAQSCSEGAGKSLNVSAPQGYGSSVNIKTEPESPNVIYIYESSQTCGKENEMLQDQQLPIQSTVQGSIITDSVSSSSSSSAQAVSTSVPVAVLSVKDPESQTTDNNSVKRINSQVASSAVSSTSTDKSNSNTRSSATNSVTGSSATSSNTRSSATSSSPSAVQTSNTSVDRNNSISVPSNNRNNSSPKTLYEKEPKTRTRSPKPSSLASDKTSGSSSKEKSPKAAEDTNVQFDVEKKGNYKCAHCRFLATKALEVRVHMLERHKMNPLYGLDMLAEECKVPRFMLFCPKDQCTFCTKDKDFFLKHLDTCASVGNGLNFTDEYKKRLEITRNFALLTLKKLQMLTQ